MTTFLAWRLMSLVLMFCSALSLASSISLSLSFSDTLSGVFSPSLFLCLGSFSLSLLDCLLSSFSLSALRFSLFFSLSLFLCHSPSHSVSLLCSCRLSLFLSLFPYLSPSFVLLFSLLSQFSPLKGARKEIGSDPAYEMPTHIQRNEYTLAGVREVARRVNQLVAFLRTHQYNFPLAAFRSKESALM